MKRTVRVAGVGMVPFAKPGKSESYHTMGEKAAREALTDAWVPYHLVEQAFASYAYGDSTCGQAALYGIGMSGIPIINVNNNCASGSSALWLAQQAISTGAAECVLAVGFEDMPSGALKNYWTDRRPPLHQFIETMRSVQGFDEDAPRAAQYFAGAARSYMDKYGARPETFAKVSVKARRHAANNPNAVFRELVTEEEVLASPTIFGTLTRLQCCPPTCGAAAAVLCSDEFARRHGIGGRGVAIRAQAMVSDSPNTFDGDMMNLVGYGMSKVAAARVYEAAGVGPESVDVVELHDCFTSNEVISYESLGLTPEGTAEKFILDGQNTYGGRVVVNPSGGLLAKGHPLGATGLAQCAELVWQLREQAGPRQVPDARIGLQHNVGLGGVAVVTMYERLG